MEAKYKTVHKLVYYRLKASPKIPRAKSLEQSEERLEDFKKKTLIKFGGAELGNDNNNE
ncbi:hypothetical protein [Microcystis aeruginosa]|uniref:hypothetical protein n=1 Tax=Microcystis aeruginosa TaxID=1126 RepID=UPI00232FBE7E|nr:hypothetical protein [Microcystis aeruginosa]MDB9415334.1 hypothetical protein [Microcystis aeruginosa CS-556/03]